MSLSRDVVLLITHSDDFFTIDRVAQALSKRGAQPFRLDTDKFPLAVGLQTKLGNFASHHQLQYGNCNVSASEVRAVWMRRICNPQLNENLPQKLKAACARESIAALEGFWDSLAEAKWVDDLHRINAAENKLRQLKVAKSVGLVIPQTLVTNIPQQAREFFYQVKGKMIAKLLTPLSQSMKSSRFFLYTSMVTEEDLQDAESLRHSPMVFQERIPKLLELRVVFVDGKLFVGALDASEYETSTVDWRQVNSDICMWQPHELPLSLIDSLQAFMSKLGLTFGAFDFIQTPTGEYVFLEVNPTGEWGMLERDLGYPISEAIANALLC